MIRSSLLGALPGVEHAFGERGDLPPPHVRAVQVHGAAVARVEDPEAAPGEADALVTRKTGLRVAVVTADCVPVLLADPEAGGAGCVHAGWRGTAVGVVGAGVRALVALAGGQASPRRLWAAVGPAIGPCCYEVGPEVLEALERSGGLPEGCVRRIEGSTRLDLPGVVALRLKEAGLLAERIDLLRACTACAPDRFHSYRRDRRAGPAGRGRQTSWIRLDGAALRRASDAPQGISLRNPGEVW